MKNPRACKAEGKSPFTDFMSRPSDGCKLCRLSLCLLIHRQEFSTAANSLFELIIVEYSAGAKYHSVLEDFGYDYQIRQRLQPSSDACSPRSTMLE